MSEPISCERRKKKKSPGTEANFDVPLYRFSPDTMSHGAGRIQRPRFKGESFSRRLGSPRPLSRSANKGRAMQRADMKNEQPAPMSHACAPVGRDLSRYELHGARLNNFATLTAARRATKSPSQEPTSAVIYQRSGSPATLRPRGTLFLSFPFRVQLNFIGGTFGNDENWLK